MNNECRNSKEQRETQTLPEETLSQHLSNNDIAKIMVLLSSMLDLLQNSEQNHQHSALHQNIVQITEILGGNNENMPQEEDFENENTDAKKFVDHDTLQNMQTELDQSTGYILETRLHHEGIYLI